MATNIPLTIQATIKSPQAGMSAIHFGDQHLTFSPAVLDNYWVVVLDRSNLDVKANFSFSDTSQIPPELKPFLGDTGYIMIFTTSQLSFGNFPKDGLYDFLISEGAGTALKTGIQISEALKDNWINKAAYTLVAILGEEGSRCYESMDIEEDALITALQLIPIMIEGKTLYTPAAIS